MLHVTKIQSLDVVSPSSLKTSFEPKPLLFYFSSALNPDLVLQTVKMAYIQVFTAVDSMHRWSE